MSARELTIALGGGWHGGNGMARCPAHNDRNPSLSIRTGDDGKLLVHCHAGCQQDRVIDALRTLGGWPAPKTNGQRHPRAHRGQAPIREFFYKNEAGEVAFCNCRYNRERDKFRPWTLQSDGTWACGGKPPAPYQLHDWGDLADVLIATEGERDADALARLGYTATSFKFWRDVEHASVALSAGGGDRRRR
jgi:hypothetical protein